MMDPLALIELIGTFYGAVGDEEREEEADSLIPPWNHLPVFQVRAEKLT